MGRQGPRLVPFLQNGMINKKYRNLINEDRSGLVFSIVLPHKTKKLEREDELIFKDWYALNGKKYVFHSKHYTDAKQAIMASLRKSDYVTKVHISDDKLTYRILSKAEVKEKKRLKKEQKKSKELKKEASDSDDGSSSVESGYGSGVESPRNDNAQVLLCDNLVTPSDNGYGRGADSPISDYAEMSVNNLPSIPTCQESSLLVNTMETSSSLGLNDVLLNIFSGKFDGFVKAEPMDNNISADDSLPAPETPILFETELFTNLQPFVDNLKPEDYFPENHKQATTCEELIGSSLAPELYNSDYVGSLAFENENGYLDGLSDEFLNSLLSKDVPALNSDSSMICEDTINNQSSEMQNGQKLNEEFENILTEDFWNSFGDISNIDSHSTVAFKEKSPENILPSPDHGVPDPEMEAKENIYVCKNCVRLGKIPILFCEPQFERKPTETSGEIKIVFEESVLKDLNGCKSVKEYKFINDHLLVILEPDDE